MRSTRYTTVVNKETSAPIILGPGRWQTTLYVCEIPETLTSISWKLNLFNAINETGVYNGEIVNWMLFIRRTDNLPDGLNIFPMSVDGEPVFAGPTENLIATGWIIVDAAISRNSDVVGPYSLVLNGGGGTLVDGSGTISDISGSYLDAGGNGLTWPSGGGNTIASSEGRSAFRRKMKVGDQLWFTANYLNVQFDPPAFSGAQMLGTINYTTKRPK